MPGVAMATTSAEQKAVADAWQQVGVTTELTQSCCTRTRARDTRKPARVDTSLCQPNTPAQDRSECEVGVPRENASGARLGVDIGGTFTDVALELGERRWSAKILTTPEAPERAVIEVIHRVLGEAGLAPADLSIIIHGTTLATNALIERKGAKTALLTTEGFRDTIEIRHENRFEQYDVNIDLPPPSGAAPAALSGASERIDAKGRVLVPLDEAGVAALAETLAAQGIEAVAIGFLHSFTNPAHERRAGELLAQHLPGVPITLSSDVSPEMREYERFSTACANAYVQPLIGRYIANLETLLAREGFVCPLFLMLSGGGLTSAETAIRFPVRLVEFGPAGGAIFAAEIARQCGLDKVLSYDMGGTTAKICLIDELKPQTSRAFEVARIYRFKKGSGLPLRIPVIEMVEIGAGGGSIARIDALKRITVGPDSAGADPGPACYGRGGEAPTVTDADLVLGRIDPTGFSGGRMALDHTAAEAALRRDVAEPLGLALELAALGVSEIVDENMANAARVHAIESGKDARGRTLVAFGGAAPCTPRGSPKNLASTGYWCRPMPGSARRSAFCARRSPMRSCARHCSASTNSTPSAANALMSEMRAEAEAIVRRGAPDATADRDPLGLYALSRPRPRDRGAVAGPAVSQRRRRNPARRLRGRLSPALPPHHSRRRSRGVELGVAALGAAARRSRRNAAFAATRLHALPCPPASGVRPRTGRVRHRRDPRAPRPQARRANPRPRDHRRRRNLDRHHPPLHRQHRPVRLHQPPPPSELIRSLDH